MKKNKEKVPQLFFKGIASLRSQRQCGKTGTSP